MIQKSWGFLLIINTTMKINEFTTPLKTYIATVRIQGITIRTSVSADNVSHATLLLVKLYGAGNVLHLSESMTSIDETATPAKVLSPSELQVKSLADQEARIKKQKKQLQARQALAKAQAGMLDASRII